MGSAERVFEIDARNGHRLFLGQPLLVRRYQFRSLRVPAAGRGCGSNEVPESLSLEVSETGEEGSRTTLKSIGPDAEFTLDYKAEYADSGRYFRVKGVFEGYEPIYDYFEVNRSGFYFTEQPAGESVRIGYSAGTSWQTSHTPERIEVMAQGDNGEWDVDQGLTALVVDDDSITVPNDGWDGSLHLKIVAWYEGNDYTSDDFYIGWYYMKGDFDDDKVISVSDEIDL